MGNRKKYEIDRSDEHKIVIRCGEDEIEFTNSFPGGVNVVDCYIVRFEKFDDNSGDLSNKIVVYTDVNGCEDQTIITEEELNKKYIINTGDIEFGVDYIALFYYFELPGNDEFDGKVQNIASLIKLDNVFRNTDKED